MVLIGLVVLGAGSGELSSKGRLRCLFCMYSCASGDKPITAGLALGVGGCSGLGLGAGACLGIVMGSGLTGNLMFTGGCAGDLIAVRGVRAGKLGGSVMSLRSLCSSVDVLRLLQAGDR